MNWLNKLLWWCAGANISILEKCPTDQAKYFGLGGTILFTALMASFAGGYAFFTAFHNVPLAFAFALFWGALIFNLDRYIVSSTGKGDGTVKITKEECQNALPRLALAIIIGFVVSTPLELKVFEREINVEVQEMIDEKKRDLIEGQNYNLQEIQRVKNRIAELRDEEKRLTEQIKGGDPRINISEQNLASLSKEEKELRTALKKIAPTYDKASKDYSYHRKRASDYKKQIAVYERATSIDSLRQLDEYKKRYYKHKKDRDKTYKIKKKYEPSVKKIRSQLASIAGDKTTEVNSVKDVRQTLGEDYQALLDKNKNEIEKLDEQLENISNIRRSEVVHSEEIAKQFNGLMARLIALDRLSVEVDSVYANVVPSMVNPNTDGAAILSAPAPVRQVASVNKTWTPVFYAKWMLALLVICIEIAPILFKMMTESGPYDDRLEEIKYASEVQKKKFISDLNQQINAELTMSNALNKNKIDTELKANQELMDAIALAQAEIAAIAIKEWQNKKMAEVQNNPELIVREKKV